MHFMSKKQEKNKLKNLVAVGDFVIQSGTVTTRQVADHFDMSVQKASQYLGRLRQQGIVNTVKRGEWSA